MVIMAPLIQELPLIGAVQCYCVEPPLVELEYCGTAAALLTKFPAIPRVIQGVIDDVLASMILLPNRYFVPLAYPLPLPPQLTDPVTAFCHTFRIISDP